MKGIKILFLVVIASSVLSSCEKYSEINNIGTVKTPYVLYMGGLLGTLHKTNDATYFERLFPIDNSPVRQIITADSNLLYLKQNCYISDNEGSAFNIVNDHARPYIDIFNDYFLPAQMLYDESANIVYLCTATGLEKSTDLGKTFVSEGNWGTGGPIIPRSITETDNGDLFIIQDDQNVFKLTGGTGNWNQIVQGSALPNANPAEWYLSHTHDTIIAVDYDGVDGVFYSTNGANWNSFSGLSGNGRNILFANQPFGMDNIFIGRDSAGLFMSNGTSFVSKSVGLPLFAKVQFVEGKRVIYRTDVAKDYLFCATDLGLYISESNGNDWRKVREGNFSTLH